MQIVLIKMKEGIDFSNEVSNGGLIWFGLVVFYDISTLVGYLMPNPIYTWFISLWFVSVGDICDL